MLQFSAGCDLLTWLFISHNCFPDLSLSLLSTKVCEIPHSTKLSDNVIVHLLPMAMLLLIHTVLSTPPSHPFKINQLNMRYCPSHLSHVLCFNLSYNLFLYHESSLTPTDLFPLMETTVRILSFLSTQVTCT